MSALFGDDETLVNLKMMAMIMQVLNRLENTGFHTFGQ